MSTLEEKAKSPPVQLVGTVIKAVNADTVFGFIRPVNGTDGEDVYVHLSRLKFQGFSKLDIGDIVTFWARNIGKGWKLDDVISIHKNPTPTQDAEPETGKWEEVRVKWYNSNRGYGHLTSATALTDIFIHAETLKAFGIKDIKQNQVLEVFYIQTEKGLAAKAVKTVKTK